MKTILITIGLVLALAFTISYLTLKQPDSNPSFSPEENKNGLLNENSSSPPQGIPSTVSETKPETKSDSKENNNMHLITIETDFGEIQFTTYDADAPKAVTNFISLANKGFYNNLTFHRIIKGFMIQGGDPKGDGTSGPGYQFEDELNPNTESYKAGYKKGVVAMANSGPNTNGSQFFIMMEDYPLPNNYTIFGKVIKGQEVVDKIGLVKTGAGDRPLEPVKMKKVVVGETK